MLSSDSKLTQDVTKLHNQRLVLKVIYEAQAVSRADIARATRLTRTTCSNVVAELIEEGLVAEGGQGPSAGGKPPTLLHVVADSRYAIAIDLAGSEVQGMLYDLRGRAIQRRTAPLAAASDGSALALVLSLLDELVSLADRPLLGIGIGLPGLIDTQEGVILRAVNLGWQDLPLRQLVQERHHLPVYLVNDAQAAALAQYTFANPGRVADLAVVLVGQGISAGLILNGQLYRGSSYSGASEIGHVRVVEGGELCACGNFGCLETVAGEGAVVRWAQTILANDSASPLHQWVTDRDSLNIDAVLRAYQGENRALEQLVAQVGRYLGSSIAHLISVLNIPLVVLAGSVARFGDRLAEVIRVEYEQRSLSVLARHSEIRISELGEDIVARGAAALLLANELGVV